MSVLQLSQCGLVRLGDPGNDDVSNVEEIQQGRVKPTRINVRVVVPVKAPVEHLYVLVVGGKVDCVVTLDALQPYRGREIAGQERRGIEVRKIVVVIVASRAVAPDVRAVAEVAGRRVCGLRPEELRRARGLIVPAKVYLYEPFPRLDIGALRDGRPPRREQVDENHEDYQVRRNLTPYGRESVGHHTNVGGGEGH